MPKVHEVTPQDSRHVEAEKVPSDQGDTIILKDHLEAEVNNISFDDSQHRVMQLWKMPTLDVHSSPVNFQEWVIMSYVHKHLISLVDATQAYIKATNSCVRFLIDENECMAKELQVAK